MTYSSEERLDDTGSEPKSTGARILPFQRPPTDLQREIQKRAQETMERERERERDRSRPAPLRWAIIFVLALIPVGLVVTGIDAFVRAFHRINDTYSKMPAPAAQTEAAPTTEALQQEPGIVMLQPLPEENETKDGNESD